MKVMLIVNEFPPEKIAGTAMATQALAKKLSEKGHQVCVLVTTACPKNKIAEIAEHDYALVWLKPRPYRGLGWIWRIGQAFRHARAFKPDVIQGQAVSCGLIAGVVGRLLSVPSICYAQGYDVYQASWWQRRTEIRWGCSLPNMCLAVTQNLKQAIEAIVPVEVAVLPHAFELVQCTQKRAELRQRYGLSENAKLVCNIARLEYFKGQDVLLDAWSSCVQKYPEAELWIAGTGSLRETLEQRTCALGLQKNVRFVGFLSQQEIHHVLQAADIFVLPSREEPFGIVLLEAMAHGLPVIASDVGGIPEVVPKNGDINLVPVADVAALQRALFYALENPTMPSEINQKHALLFTWNQQVERFEKLYRKLC